MAVFRVDKNHSYTVMANHHLRDERLSLKFKGLLSLILSLPDDWRISIEGMKQFSVDGKDAIRSAIRELTDAGYITRAQTHSEAGTFSGYDYIVRETPVASPSSGFPTMENPTLRNTEKLSTNIPPIVPRDPGDGCAGECTPEPEQKPTGKPRGGLPQWKPERFAAFWSYYPRGENKQRAVKAWDKLKPDDTLIATMGRALAKQKASPDWQRGIGIPHASTWLNGRRWEDEQRKLPQLPPQPQGSGWAEDREVLD